VLCVCVCAVCPVCVCCCVLCVCCVCVVLCVVLCVCCVFCVCCVCLCVYCGGGGVVAAVGIVIPIFVWGLVGIFICAFTCISVEEEIETFALGPTHDGRVYHAFSKTTPAPPSFGKSSRIALLLLLEKLIFHVFFHHSFFFGKQVMKNSRQNLL